jgi:hypothetical protein
MFKLQTSRNDTFSLGRGKAIPMLNCLSSMEWRYSVIWRWVVSSKPLPLYPKEEAPSTHYIRGWAGAKAAKISRPARNWNLTMQYTVCCYAKWDSKSILGRVRTFPIRPFFFSYHNDFFTLH